MMDSQHLGYRTESRICFNEYALKIAFSNILGVHSFPMWPQSGLVSEQLLDSYASVYGHFSL